MFVWFHDSVSKLSHTRLCETCRWDVPAAAVIHPHKLLLRLRTQAFIHSSLLACIHASLISSHRFTHFSLYSLNVHSYTSCVFIFYHSLINFDFTFLTFHLCLFILFLHTATFIDQDTNLTHFDFYIYYFNHS